ncbi:probable glucan endo-1,3-beta-glucosidase A6 [Neltuma alba]|uniref:probable glucan endo-1,3-beta-glucosidase A6 n=1 Tax=Neltuma alba TaxID=207710 RepID=UPI0010A3EB1C|nr:probable glucan endo-1,3-beta-glucosidase A6 [Prosopis alba]
MKAGRVKLYDANPEILNLLSETKFEVSIMVPNSEISSIASNQSISDEWVRQNVLPYYPKTLIRFLLVGNEVLSDYSVQGQKIWLHLVPAMRRIKRSLNAQNITNIKVSTPVAMDVLETTFPPSSGAFQSRIKDTVMVPMLEFLHRTNSFFFIDAYTYFPWSSNPNNISLDFALLGGNFTTTDPVSGFFYTNLLDQMLDSVIFAMSKLGFPGIRLVISETGWPNSGDMDEAGANIYNAAMYNRNLIKKITAKPPLGTPARPGVVIPTFIFSLYDENLKNGPEIERHWGLLHPDGTPLYEIDLTGKRAPSDFAPLPSPMNNSSYRGKVWCMAARGANPSKLSRVLKSYTKRKKLITCMFVCCHFAILMSQLFWLMKQVVDLATSQMSEDNEAEH